MVEVTATGQNIEKRMKRNESSLRTRVTGLNTATFALQVPGGEESWKGPEKYLKTY